LRLCGSQRQHPLVQREPRGGDASGTLLHGHSDSCYRGQSGGKETGAGISGHFPGYRPAVYRVADFRGFDRWSTHFLPCLEPGADSGALAHECREGVLRKKMTTAQAKSASITDRKILKTAIVDSFWKLDPRLLIKNPVMFVVEVGAVITGVVLVLEAFQHKGHFWFGLQITLWLWFTVLFANFAEAMAEGRGKAQAETLRKARAETQAHRLRSDGSTESVVSSKLRSGDIVFVTAGDFIPGDGEVIEGVASVDESAITGESAPVIREAGGDRSAVTGGTRVLSDWV